MPAPFTQDNFIIYFLASAIAERFYGNNFPKFIFSQRFCFGIDEQKQNAYGMYYNIVSNDNNNVQYYATSNESEFLSKKGTKRLQQNLHIQ